MPDSAQALFLIVLTMPGIVGFFVFSHLYCNRIEANFDKTAFVILLNLMSILELSFAVDLKLLQDISYQKLTFDDIRTFTLSLMLPLSICAILTGALLAILANWGGVQRGLLRAGFTRKTAHGAVLADVIVTYPDAYFKVRFKSGGYVIGHPRKYSLLGDECCLFLENAARRPPRPAPNLAQPPEAAIDGEGILLLNFDDVSCVEILKGTEPERADK